MAKRVQYIDDAYFKSGRVRSGFDFAQILGDVMRSDAYKACPDYATRVLFALAAQFRKSNNGDLSMTAADAEQYGIESEWKLRAGLSVLERVGLVEIMRQGRISAGKGIASLYALGWRQIDASDKYDLPSVLARAAPNRWARWTRPDDWGSQLDTIRNKAQGKNGKNKRKLADLIREQAEKNSHHTRAEQAATHVGSENTDSRYTRVEQEKQIPATHVGGTLKSSGSPSGPVPASNPQSKAGGRSVKPIRIGVASARKVHA